MILGSLKKSKKQSFDNLKHREQDTRRTSGNTTRNDPFPPFLLLEAQTQVIKQVVARSGMDLKMAELKFTWVFFLASKDETSGILKSFITEIENLVDKKVKIIRCDNGTEFKNRVMSKFCKKKGIKREFSIARTPQQNGVAERRNRTLIEAARTMLADSKLPTTFWAEVVNTACYVQNRVLVVKPYNKTPYELFRGRTPAISFMRPFGCHVTILNTLDYLGKFDGKSDEGFFVGYSLNSDGPKWLFDIDVLTKSMNYVPVVAGTNSNDFIGTEESIGAGHSSKETGSSQDYILMPLWKDGSLFDSSSKNASNFLVMLERRMMKVTTPNPYSAATQFGGVTDWYQSQGYREPDTVMSDFEDSTVTYTEVSSSFTDLSDIESPRVDGPPVMPEDPYAYVPVYPEFMPPEDEVLLAEEQPLLAATSPTADSPGYDESSDDDKDDIDVDIEEDEEEEEHLAPADSTAIAFPAVDHAPSAEETESFETNKPAATPPPHLAYRVTTRISIQDEPPIPFSSDIEIPSPPLLVSPPLPLAPPPLPVSPTYLLGYRIAMIQLRAEALFTSYLPLPHIILSHTRAYTPPSADRPEVCLPPRKRLCFAFGPRYEVGESSSAAAARPTREAWGQSMDASDLARSEVMSLRTTVLGQQAVITKLQAVDRRRHAAITELLAVDRRRYAQFIEALKLLKGLPTQVTEFQRQQGPAKALAQPDAPEEAGSSS
ncbi:putative ribonuclease H-like domain-containing protein [Tanacetum coccineum]